MKRRALLASKSMRSLDSRPTSKSLFRKKIKKSIAVPGITSEDNTDSAKDLEGSIENLYNKPKFNTTIYEEKTPEKSTVRK